MKFKIKFNKWSNFYFFVSNLSDWAAHCDKRINKFWKKELNGLNKNEKKALEDFKKVRRKYRKSNSFFEYAFYKKENPWSVLENKLFLEDYKKIKNTFDVLNNKFEKIYKKETTPLKEWKKILNTEINNKKNIKKIKEIVNNLYQTNSFIDIVNVYLLMSSPKTRGGEAYIDNKSVSVKISKTNKPSSYIASLIWHETLHLLEKRSNFIELMQKLSFNSRFRGNIIEYSITSLFPKGVLGKKFFDVKLSKRETIRNDLSLKQGEKIMKLIKEYIEKKKPLDENYIKKMSVLVNN